MNANRNQQGNLSGQSGIRPQTAICYPLDRWSSRARSCCPSKWSRMPPVQLPCWLANPGTTKRAVDAASTILGAIQPIRLEPYGLPQLDAACRSRLSLAGQLRGQLIP